MKKKRRGLLEGLLILDLADERGSFCSKLLADLGATTIKVEPPGGDPSRTSGPYCRSTSGRKRLSLPFFYHNTNKLGIVLDLGTVKGRQAFKSLVERADVLIETFPPGYLKARSLDYAHLSGLNPRLIHISITGFGQTGPKRDYVSNDLVLSAFGGQMYVSGAQSGRPVKLFGRQAYYTASLFGAVAVLLGLRKRQATGRGSYIDLSAQEAVASLLDHVMTDYFQGGRSAPHEDIRSRNEFSILRCKDGHIQITILRDWDTLVELMASEGKAGDLIEEKWRRETYRVKHFEHILEVVEGWTRYHTKRELFLLGQSMRFPWAPIHSLREVLASPQLKSRGFFVRTRLWKGGPFVAIPALPYRFSSHSAPPLEHSPLLGKLSLHILKRFGPLKEKHSDSCGKAGKSGSLLTGYILSGMRVIDLSRMLSGPYATRIMADFGADVIKVQSRKTSQGAERNDTPYFNTWNRNKRSITLDLGVPEARDIFLKLVAVSDVVVENFSPRVMANWGLTYKQLKKTKPDIIMLSLSAMGQTGPWKDFIGFGPSFHALSGLISETSRSLKTPANLGHAYGDMIAGLYAAIAVLAALERRDKTGEGQHIDLSSYEALCTLLGPALMECSVNPRSNCDMCFDPYSDAAPEGCYRCKGDDRWCVISVGSEKGWKSLCRIIRQPELESKRFFTPARRRKNRSELDSIIERWTANHPAGFIVRRLQNSGVAAGVVQNAKDLARDPQLAARRFFVSLKHPVLGETVSDRSPLWPWQQKPAGWKPSPRLGEHNHDVFLKLLGLSDEKFRCLVREGIIG